jgi:hypothetical protein
VKITSSELKTPRGASWWSCCQWAHADTLLLQYKLFKSVRAMCERIAQDGLGGALSGGRPGLCRACSFRCPLLGLCGRFEALRWGGSGSV